MLRNYKWEKSIISPEERAEKYNQKSTLIILTGTKDSGRKEIAKTLEDKLFEDGKIVYFLGIGNVLYGIDADIKGKENQRQEHIRRLSEVANILIDAGIILIITALELTQDDLEIMKTILEEDFRKSLSFIIKYPLSFFKIKLIAFLFLPQFIKKNFKYKI